VAFPIIQHEGELTRAKKRRTATGPAKVIIVNPDQGAAKKTTRVCEEASQALAWIHRFVD
jgi:phosphoribosylpyrophosphate synthetase